MTTPTTPDRQDAQREPVVWMRQDFDGEWIETMPGKGIPFYTQPTALSIETIEQIFFKLVDRDPWEHRDEKFYTEFARAIERAHGIGE